MSTVSLGAFITLGAVILWLAPSARGFEPSPVSLSGLVVDAACFMLHPQAADGPTHDECGNACALAGVPLGVFDAASKQLYLADGAGSKQLLPHLHKRVRITGQAVKTVEPLTLQKPVGENNTMTVRVDGGYMALTVGTVERVP